MKEAYQDPPFQPPSGKKTSPTIGFFTHGLIDDYAMLLWHGVMDAAAEEGLNLITCPGRDLGSTHEFDAQANVVYKLIGVENVDGLLISGGPMSSFVGLDGYRRFCTQYHDLPMVSIAVALEGVPSVLVDNYQGLWDVMTHLMTVHHRKRIAFIRGPEGHFEADERYRAYRDALTASDLFFDPALVTAFDNFDGSWGYVAIRQMLHERQTNFDAVVASCDGMAFMALHALHEEGINIPDDVIVTGFNDAEDAQFSYLPLTTVRQPVYEEARQAVKLLAAHIRGESVPELVTLPTELIVRRSCGCISPIVLETAVQPTQTDTQTVTERLSTQRGDIIALMRTIITPIFLDRHSPSHATKTDSLERLFDLLLMAIEDDAQPERVLSYLDTFLRQTGEKKDFAARWQRGVSELRRQIRPLLHSPQQVLRAENLWQQIRIMVGEIGWWGQMHLKYLEEGKSRLVRQLGHTLITASDVQDLMHHLAHGLRQVKIPGCVVALYDDSTEVTRWSWSLLTCDAQQHRISKVGERGFPTRQIFPDGWLTFQPRFNIILAPLFFRNIQFGFVVFEVGQREGKTYEALCGYLNSALQGTLLIQKIQEQNVRLQEEEKELAIYRQQLEERVAARTAELTRANTQLQTEIVERKQGEHDLRASEHQYRLLAENVKDGVIIVQEGKLVFANTAFASLVGYASDALLETKPLAFFPAQARQEAQTLLQSKSRDSREKLWQVELVNQHKETIWTEIERSTIVWNSQPALLLTVRNINQSKLRESRLEEERSRLHQENLTFKSTITERYRFGHLIGKSALMQRVYELIISAAASNANVLINGESGTGKELIARTIHQLSSRKQRTFVPVNCASIPETLFEREFFGHQKGSFTGADRDKPGLFDQAHRGVLFLDEVTELQPGMQAKLLRVLQDGEYLPLGGTVPKTADVVIVAATNKDCRKTIEKGELRQDFFYRICVIDIQLPPLRERKEDLPLLIGHFLEQYARKQGKKPEDVPSDVTMLPGELLQALYEYSWPGNVRELQNVLQRYLATNDLDSVVSLLTIANPNHPHDRSPSSLSKPSIPRNGPIRDHVKGYLSKGDSLRDALNTFEKHMLAESFVRNQYHAERTALELDIPLRTLYRKIKQHGLIEKRFVEP